MTQRDRPKSGPKTGWTLKIRLAASENYTIRRVGGQNAVSGAQTLGKPVFDGAELDFDAFSTSGKCVGGQLRIMPSQEAIFSV